jgi:Fic family protein
MAEEVPRAGYYVAIPKGHRAFVPYPLPPNPPVDLTQPEMMPLLLDAERALAELGSFAQPVFNMQLFVDMYVRRETVSSSHIEGSQATMMNVLEYENVAPGALQGRLFEGEAGRPPVRGEDIVEGINYVKAMNYGLERLHDLPLSLRLIKELHRILMTGVRGEYSQAGHFRTDQCHVGPIGATIEQATYVPPPDKAALKCIGELEKFFHQDLPLPALIKTGLIHCQFEMIHPFADGNGRIGRLLIPFYLYQQGLLKQPLLYISSFFKQHRREYYDRLRAVSDSGDWEGWLAFFLRGVIEVSKDAAHTADKASQLYGTDREIAMAIGSKHAVPLLNHLCQQPHTTSAYVQKALGVSQTAADSVISKFEHAGILVETTGQQRYRRYLYREYVELFTEGTEPL